MSSQVTSEDPLPPFPVTHHGTVADVDMVGYAETARMLEQNFGAAAVAQLNRQIQAFMTAALAPLPDPDAYQVIGRPGDGILLFFNHAADAHAFACNVHHLARQHSAKLSERLALRIFRVGLATGDVTVTRTPGAPSEFAGMAIADATRLEAKAAHSGTLISADTLAILPAELQRLYAAETRIRGKRDEIYRAHHCHPATPAKRPKLSIPPILTRHLLTRRAFVSITLSAAGGAGCFTAWSKRDVIYNYLHPIPKKRFVALLGWPRPADSGLIPTISIVLDAIEQGLSRAEYLDRDLLVIQNSEKRALRSLEDVNELRESLGANLVLAASARASQAELELTLSILGFPSSHELRTATINVPIGNQLELPAEATSTAANLLGIKKYKADRTISAPRTSSPEAFLAFQTAEELIKDDNDVNLEKAIQKYREAIDLDSKYALAHARLAVAYCRLAILRHDPAAIMLAQENAETAVLLDPSSAPAHMALASVNEQRGNLGNALEEMKNALAVDPSNPQTLVWQAQIYTRLNRWQDAESSFGRAIKARPNNWIAHNEFGVLLNAQGKYLDAFGKFQAAHLIAPRSTLPLNNIGSIYLQLGDLVRAEEYCQQSLDIKLTSLTSETMAAIFRAGGQFAQSIPHALRATELDPEESTGWLELADCYSLMSTKAREALKAYQRASKVQEDALKTDPNDGPGLMLYALCKAKSEQSSAIDSIIERADQCPAGDMDSLITKARTLEVTKQRWRALSTLNQCFARGATRYQVETTPDLQDLRSDPAYISMASHVV